LSAGNIIARATVPGKPGRTRGSTQFRKELGEEEKAYAQLLTQLGMAKGLKK